MWIEYRLGWLSKQFPRSAFSTGRELILPTPGGLALPDAAGTFEGGLRKHVITLDRGEFRDSENL